MLKMGSASDTFEFPDIWLHNRSRSSCVTVDIDALLIPLMSYEGRDYCCIESYQPSEPQDT